MDQFDTLSSQYRHVEHMHEGVWSHFLQITALRTIFPVPSWGDQLLPQFIAVLIQSCAFTMYTYQLNIIMKEFDSKNSFDKITAMRTSITMFA